MISAKRQRIKYIIGDFIAANAAWFLYNFIRYSLGGIQGGFDSFCRFIGSENIIVGQIVFPILMMMIFHMSGYYVEVFRKSRLQELLTTATSVLASSLLIFFIALINDMVNDNRTYNYELFFIMYLVVFLFVYTVRLIITNKASRNIKSRRWSFRTLIIGSGSSAATFVQRIEKMKKSLGYNVVGYVSIPGENQVKNIGKPVYELDNIAQVCADNSIEELIVVPTKHNSTNVLKTIDHVFALNLPIKMTLDKFNVMFSRARINNFYGDPLVDIASSNMSNSGKVMKRYLDVFVSIIALLLLIPAFIIIAICIRTDSKGCIIYRQERLGMHNKPFMIYKFRSMIQNAETNNNDPRLSSDNDPRVTKVGKVLRKYRLDETPQFWNVIKGDMSLVGPRPERKYFADKIIEQVPAYSLVHQVRPGVTSMGMVKFGYATTIEEMIKRFRFDLIYLENMSLLNDLKIIIYTFKIIFTGRGM